jgi:hypothetical protein
VRALFSMVDIEARILAVFLVLEVYMAYTRFRARVFLEILGEML